MPARIPDDALRRVKVGLVLSALAISPIFARGEAGSEPSRSASAWSPATAYLPVEPEHPVYDDLEHFRALGLWRGSLELRPMTRARIATAARSIEASARARAGDEVAGEVLSDDPGTASLARKVSPSLPGLGPGDAVRWRRLVRCLASWGMAGPVEVAEDRKGPPRRGTMALDPGSFPPTRFELSGGLRFVGLASGLDSLVDLDRRGRRDFFPWIAGDVAAGERLFARLRFVEDYSRLTPHEAGREWSDNLPPSARRTFTDPSARNDRAVVGLGWDWAGIRLGREDRRWGAGRLGTLFLGENSFPLDGLSFHLQTRRVAGSSLFAQLRRGGKNVRPLPSSSSWADSLPPGVEEEDGWLAAHRVEVMPPGPVRVALWEAVAYGRRGLDLAYSNPVTFLLAATQDIHDRARIDDKKVIGFDLGADLPPLSLYGEFLVNRLVTLDAAADGEDSEISGYAQLAGLRWANPAGWSGADLDLEYAHLDPEVYFHHDGDPTRHLLSEGEVIGHWLGPNADLFHAALTLPPSRRGDALRLWYEQARWGLLDGRRGLEAGFVGLRRRDKEWITGPKEVERVYAVAWRRPDLAAHRGVGIDAAISAAFVDRAGRRSDHGWQAECHLDFRGLLRRDSRGGE